MKGGFLEKLPKNKTSRKWQRRWFVLDGTSLTYFKTQSDMEPTGRFNLSGAFLKVGDASGEWSDDVMEQQLIMTINKSTGQDKMLVIKAEDKSIFKGWVEELEKAGCPIREMDTGVLVAAAASESNVIVKTHLPDGGYKTTQVPLSTTIVDVKRKILKTAYKGGEEMMPQMQLLFQGAALDESRQLGDLQLKTPGKCELRLRNKGTGAVSKSVSSAPTNTVSAAPFPTVVSSEAPGAEVPILAGYLSRAKVTVPDESTDTGFFAETPTRTVKWSKRWVMLLNTGRLEVYRAVEDPAPNNTVDLNSCALQQASETDYDRPHTFVITHPSLKDLPLSADTAADFQSWVSAIEVLIQTAPEKPPGQITGDSVAEWAPQPISVLHRGHLAKGKVSKDKKEIVWRQRWFTLLSDGTLNRFRSKTDMHAVQSIDLSGCSFHRYVRGEHKYNIRVNRLHNARPWKLAANSDQEQREWCEALIKAGCADMGSYMSDDEDDSASVKPPPTLPDNAAVGDKADKPLAALELGSNDDTPLLKTKRKKYRGKSKTWFEKWCVCKCLLD